MIHGAKAEVIQIDFIEFFLMGAMSAFDTTVEFWRMGWEHERPQVGPGRGGF